MATITIIDRYTIIKQLGKGNLGSVLLAQDKQYGHLVVVKKLDIPIASRSNIKLQLVHEARRAAKLSHPNIATILDVGEYDGVPYLVYEYIDGISLDRLIRKENQFSISRAVALMTGILEGIGHAHRNGLLHLNLKPSRIIVEKEDVPRIMNFGISVMMRAQKGVDGIHDYLSPEHISNAPLSHRADIFSLGLILYQMLAGKPAVTTPKAIAEFDRSEIIPPSYLNNEVTEKLDRTVMKALAGKPEERYADAGAMKKDMDACFLEAIDSVGSASPKQSYTTLEQLLRIMERSQDFPAFSQHILEINQKASLSEANSTSPAQLAGIILKDYSLTNKLLRLVNSAFYGNFSGKITTITRAVMVLGFEQVSLAASSLMLFDHLQNKSQSEELKDAAISSFMSGLVARDMSGKIGTRNLEESFICAMLHNLGKHLVIYYLPDQANEIKTMIAQKGENERNAAWTVLRISYEDIGMAVLKSWNFPVKIIGSLTRMPEGKVEKPSSDEDVLRSLAGYSNELCDIIRKHQGNDRTIALKNLANRFQKVVPVSGAQLVKMLNAARTQMEKYSDVLGIDIRSSQFMQRLSMDTEPVDEKATGESAFGKFAETGAALDQEQAAFRRDDHLDILINGIQEITNALLSDYSLNDMMFMILETMYRGFAFNHVVFCMMEVSRTKMRARHAFGADVRTFTDNFGFSITNRPTDLFNMAISQRRDIIVEDAEDPGVAALIPEWYRKAFLAPAFIIYPIMVKNTPFGIFYADKKTKGSILSPTQLNYMKTLRNQSILAIRQKI